MKNTEKAQKEASAIVENLHKKSPVKNIQEIIDNFNEKEIPVKTHKKSQIR